MTRPTKKLYWHCECGQNEEAQPDYEHGDSEPCVLCEDGVARVVTIQEAAAWEQAKALGGVWRPWHDRFRLLSAASDLEQRLAATEQRLAVAVEALGEIAETTPEDWGDEADLQSSLTGARLAAKSALSRIGAGKEGE